MAAFFVGEKYAFPLHLAAYLLLGADIIYEAIKNILKGDVFSEHFLMSVATIGAFFIGEYMEAVMVMLLYKIGEFFQGLAMENSRKSIRDLMNLKSETARVWRDGTEIEIAPEAVLVGEKIIIRAGEKVPLDGVVLFGDSQLDTSSLTGESLPRDISPGDDIMSGVVNITGLLEVEVTKPFGESTVAKIMDLVESSSKDKAPTERFITRFSKIYTPIVVAIAAFIALGFPLIFDGAINSNWVHQALVFLVISCPCALVISVPLSFFSGIGASSKKGILVKGGQVLENLSDVDTIVFDKTGTLTEGSFSLLTIETKNGWTEDELLEKAWQIERLSNHPIAASIIAAVKKRNLDPQEVEVFDYLEAGGHGLTGTIAGKTMLAGNDRLLESHNIDYLPVTDAIGTIIHLVYDKEYMGYLLIGDKIRKTTSGAIRHLKEIGMKNLVMLTGDAQNVADAVAREVGIDKAFGNLLPDEKVKKVKEMQDNGAKVLFLGDGINDAPVLVMSEVGGAMGGVGSDAAVEAADIVIMNDEISRVPIAIEIANRTMSIAKQNILFALGVKFFFMFLSVTNIFVNMKVAVLVDVGMTILLVFNAMRILKDVKQEK